MLLLRKSVKSPIEKPTHSRTLEKIDPKLTDRDIIARDFKYNKSLLTKDQQQKLFDLVCKYRKAFSLRAEIGKSKSFEYQLKLKENASLLCKQPYQLSIHEKEPMKKEIDKLLKMNVIEPVTDPYVPCCAPAILVAKRDKSARLVIDYRHTNQSLKLDHVSFPRISDILNRVAVGKYFSCFDLSDSFFQIPLHIDSRPITTFSPDSQELYQFKRVPQGMSNSPAALCHLTRRLFKEFSFLDNYADDFILHSSEIEKHFAYLEKLFQKVIDDGIKLNLKKCNMFTDECDFLGSTIKSGTISPMKRHTEAILKMGQPKDKSELLECTNYVKHVIPECAPMLQPLYKLLRKNVNFNIAEAESLAIQKLQHCLSNPPVLHAPVTNGKFQLYVDGSLKGLGTILYQTMHQSL